MHHNLCTDLIRKTFILLNPNPIQTYLYQAFKKKNLRSLQSTHFHSIYTIHKQGFPQPVIQNAGLYCKEEGGQSNIPCAWLTRNKPQAPERGEPRPSSQRDSQKWSVTVQRSERFIGSKEQRQKRHCVKLYKEAQRLRLKEDKFKQMNADRDVNNIIKELNRQWKEMAWNYDHLLNWP